MVKKHSFSREDKLVKRCQFKKVYSSGKKFVGNLLVLYILEVPEVEKKIGITVTKRIGNAVVRNRIKRLVRESYRLIKQDLSSNIHLVFIARELSGKKKLSFADINKEIMHLLSKAGIYESSDK